MFHSLLLASSAILGLAASCSAGVVQAHTRSTPFDGQYITPASLNNATEWWWIQAGAPAKPGEFPPAFHVTFYQGYPLSALRELSGGAASAPENYIVINGAFANGTAFAYELVASSSSVTGSGSDVTGTWTGAGSFHNTLSAITVTLDGPGVTGTLTLTSDAPHHFGCNTTSGPYFDSAVPAGTELNSYEKLFYEEVGWATSQPGGVVTVDVNVDGTPLKFTGHGYHDANWMNQPIDAFIDNWYFVNAQVGPFDLSAIWAQITDSKLNFATGFLEHSEVILQNQCGVQGDKLLDIATITPWGSVTDTVNNVNVMQGFIVDYKLKNGDNYSFNLTGETLILAQSIYHRYVGSAVGGKVGSTQYSGVMMFDWMTPIGVPYNG